MKSKISDNNPEEIRIRAVLELGNDKSQKSKELLEKGDIKIIVPSKRTSRIQEMHLIIIHAVCECLEKNLTM